MKSLYDIEVEASSLEAVKLAINELDKERDSLENKLEEKEDEINDFYDEGIKEAKKKIEEFKEEESKKFDREKDQKNYDFIREKKLREDKLKDELSYQKKTFDEYVSNRKKEIENENKELDQRIKIIELREEDINELQNEIKDLKDKNQKIYDETKEEIKKKMEEEKETALRIQNARCESDKLHLNSIIDLKNDTIIDLKQNIKSLENKLDAAYVKVNEVATSAISSTKEKELRDFMSNTIKSVKSEK